MLVESGTIIESDAIVVGPTTIGERCTIGRDTVISCSVIWDDCAVGTAAVLEHCILADHSGVDPGAVLRDSICMLPQSIERSISANETRDNAASEVGPGVAAGGKGGITLRLLLAHRGGLPAVRKRLPELAMLDWNLMCTELAEQRPFWEPDSAHGYHCNTFGFLVGEVIRRATGRDVGAARRPVGEVTHHERWDQEET